MSNFLYHYDFTIINGHADYTIRDVINSISNDDVLFTMFVTNANPNPPNNLYVKLIADSNPSLETVMMYPRMNGIFRGKRELLKEYYSVILNNSGSTVTVKGDIYVMNNLPEMFKVILSMERFVDVSDSVENYLMYLYSPNPFKGSMKYYFMEGGAAGDTTIKVKHRTYEKTYTPISIEEKEFNFMVLMDFGYIVKQGIDDYLILSAEAVSV